MAEGRIDGIDGGVGSSVEGDFSLRCVIRRWREAALSCLCLAISRRVFHDLSDRNRGGGDFWEMGVDLVLSFSSEMDIIQKFCDVFGMVRCIHCTVSYRSCTLYQGCGVEDWWVYSILPMLR